MNLPPMLSSHNGTTSSPYAKIALKVAFIKLEAFFGVRLLKVVILLNKFRVVVQI